MSLPLITVAIPTFNRPALLREALESVLRQDLKDFEVLVADDASSYDVASLIARFGDPRLRLIRQPRNVGMLRNWRTALCSATTRYVATMDDDDLWLPHHLSEAVAALDAHPEALFYSCAAERFGTKRGVFKPQWCTSPGLEVCRWEDTGYGVWLPGCPVQSSSVVLRRAALNNLFWGGKSWPWCHDWLWWGQLALRGPFLFHGRIGVKYRWHATNYTQRPINTQAKAHWLFTVRELARRAWAAGGLRDLARETRDFPASALSTVVIALSAPESPRGLMRQARAIFESRRDIAADAGCAVQYRIAASVGGWWLGYADLSTRLLARWWPVPDW
jgi:glycosyltransferase involved in cell wall biosynthesis